MKVAVIGSRNCTNVDFKSHLPIGITEVVSGGAKGVDALAKRYAIEENLPYVEFLPDYRRYGRGAPLKRNDAIIAYSDMVVAFWDGTSKGTAYTIFQCEKLKIPIKVVNIIL